MKLSNKTALVSGGAGFIGSHLVESLLENGIKKTYILDNLSTGLLDNIKPFIECDICNYDVFKKLPRVDYVYNLAALVSVPLSFEKPDNTHNINVNGFQNILEYSRINKIEKLIYASSSAIYGSPLKEEPLKEDYTPSPLSPYGFSKLINEKYAKAYFDFYNLNSIGFRFFNVFGPRQRFDSPYSGVISIFRAKMKNDDIINIFGDGNQVRDFIYVKDVVNCLIDASQSSIEYDVLNLGTGIPTSINKIFKNMSEIYGYEKKPIYNEKRQGDIPFSLSDLSKLKKNLGFTLS
jgi:nucleoside-diphosphate-sugar epimerase